MSESLDSVHCLNLQCDLDLSKYRRLCAHQNGSKILTPKVCCQKKPVWWLPKLVEGHSAGVIKRQAPTSAWRRAPSLTLCSRSASGQSLMDRQYSSLSGGELFERITAEGYTMSEAEVINYMRQICEGVKHMHERNIIHLGKPMQ